MLSDAQLVIQLQAGDEASFEALFLRHYEGVYGVLFRLLGNKADADDLTQQVFLKLYRSPKKVRVTDDANVVGWLYRVAVNDGYNALRSRQRRASWYEKLMQQWSTDTMGSDPAHLIERNDIQDTVRQVLATMKPRDAKLLLLRHTGLSYKELASALEIAPSSVGSLLTRAERAFRAKYAKTFPETEVVHVR